MFVMLVSVGKFYLRTESISNVFLLGKEEGEQEKEGGDYFHSFKEQLAGSIFSLLVYTHAFCRLAEIRIWFKFLWQGKKKKKSLTLHFLK